MTPNQTRTGAARAAHLARFVFGRPLPPARRAAIAAASTEVVAARRDLRVRIGTYPAEVCAYTHARAMAAFDALPAAERARARESAKPHDVVWASRTFSLARANFARSARGKALKAAAMAAVATHPKRDLIVRLFRLGR